MRGLVLFMVALSACTHKEPEETGIEETGVSTDCQPALRLTPSYPGVQPNLPVQINASGGTGDYLFRLGNPDSPAILNERTGTYLASNEVGTVDEVVLTDLNCDGSATTAITTYAGFTVLPEQVSLLPGQPMTPEFVDGSGEFSCEILLAPSGATLDGCDYTAGSGEGTDVLRIRDLLTGQLQDLRIEVDPEAKLEGLPEIVLLPVGATYTSEATGGSNLFSYTVLSGTIQSAGDSLTALESGESRIKITDRFAGFEKELRVVATSVISPPTLPDGQFNFYARVTSAGDLNGDGFEDAILGDHDASYHQFYGGLVSVYAGGDGIYTDDPSTPVSPVQTLGGHEEAAQFGRSIALGDFDGDGETDLAVGSPEGANYYGYINVFSGLVDDFFEDEPSLILDGDYASDRLGTGMASCDLNNDGYDDLIVGARSAEDRSASPIEYDQGALAIYMGSPAGLPSRAEAYRFGPVAKFYLGTDITAGDFNGDGYCDVAAATEYYRSNIPGDEGAVLVYLNDGAGALEQVPSVSIFGPGEFGYKITAGDLDNDGYDDLVVGAWFAPNPSGLKASGAVGVYLGSELTGLPDEDSIRLDDADWLFYSDGSYDYWGRDVAVGDANADGIDDLVIGNAADEPANGSHGGTGIVQLYLGGSSEEPTALTQEWLAYEGGAHLGVGLGYAGDLNNDGVGDWLAHADRSIIYGPDAGAPYFISTTETEPILLDYAHRSAGHEFGAHHSMVTTDLNGDAYIDLLFSGYEAGNEDTNRGNAGALYGLYGTAEGFESTPTKLNPLDPAWSTNSRLGIGLYDIGPFMGAAQPNVMIISRDQNRPDSLNDDMYANPGDCGGKRNGVGQAAIYSIDASGLNLTPVFSYFGPYASDDLQKAIGPIDVNGDGASDVVVGSWLWNNGRGGLAVIPGRAPTSELIEDICGFTTIEGPTNYDYFATSLANLGDLNADGCDDFASGAPHDSTQGGDGSVSVIWGWNEDGCTGENCCPTEPTYTTLKSEVTDVDFGDVMDAIDTNGDGLKELFIGLPASTSGGVIQVSGERLATLTAGPLDNGSLYNSDMGNTYFVQDLDGTHQFNDSPGFGAALAAIAHPTKPGAIVAMGNPSGDGRVLIYEISSASPKGSLLAIAHGETHQPGGQLGGGLHLNTVGSTLQVIVGAPEHDAPGGIDQGGLYPFVFDLP